MQLCVRGLMWTFAWILEFIYQVNLVVEVMVVVEILPPTKALSWNCFDSDMDWDMTMKRKWILHAGFEKVRAFALL